MLNKTIDKKIGEILIEIANLKNEDLQTALVDQETTNQRIGDILLSRSLITQEQLDHALSIQFKLPWVDNIVLQTVPKILRDRLSKEIALKYEVMPLKLENEILTIAMSDPLCLYMLDNLRFVVNCQVDIVMSTKKEILDNIRKLYGTEDSELPMTIDHALPDFLLDLIYEAIRAEGTKLCLGLSSRATEDFNTECMSISIFSKHELWDSNNRVIVPNSYDDCVRSVLGYFDLKTISDVIVVEVNESIGIIDGAKVSTIIVTPGKNAPRIDVYISYDEDQQKTKDIILTYADDLQALVMDSDKWNEVKEDKELIDSIFNSEKLFRKCF